ncbi:protein activity of BC1 complex kinase 7, chloroplastic, partial [Tanacetum coccineum]
VVAVEVGGLWRWWVALAIVVRRLDGGENDCIIYKFVRASSPGNTLLMASCERMHFAHVASPGVLTSSNTLKSFIVSIIPVHGRKHPRATSRHDAVNQGENRGDNATRSSSSSSDSIGTEQFDRIEYRHSHQKKQRVHRSIVHNGEKVFAKVQRPGLKKLFDIDLHCGSVIHSFHPVVAEYFQSETLGGPTRDWMGVYDECAKEQYEENTRTFSPSTKESE